MRCTRHRIGTPWRRRAFSEFGCTECYPAYTATGSTYPPATLIGPSFTQTRQPRTGPSILTTLCFISPGSFPPTTCGPRPTVTRQSSRPPTSGAMFTRGMSSLCRRTWVFQVSRSTPSGRDPSSSTNSVNLIVGFGLRFPSDPPMGKGVKVALRFLARELDKGRQKR